MDEKKLRSEILKILKNLDCQRVTVLIALKEIMKLIREAYD